MEQTPEKLQALIRRGWPVLALLAAAVLVWASGLHQALSLETLIGQRALLRGWIAVHPWAAYLGFIVIYAAVVAIAVPGAVFLTLGGGFLFGWMAGAAGAIAGATAGAVVLFLIARSALGERLRRRAGPAVRSIIDGFHADAASYLLVLRLVPLFPFFLVNLAAAALNVPFRTFLWTTALGIIPATCAYALAGAGLESALAGRVAAFDACKAAQQTGCVLAFSPLDLLTVPLLAALVLLGIVALIPAALKRWRGGPLLQQEPPLR